jgi:Bacterial PH domain
VGRALRNRSDAVIYGLGGALLIGIAIALAIGYAIDSDASLGVWLAVPALLWFGVSSAAFARTAVVVNADEASFVVRNMYRRHEVPWSEVSGFERDKFSGPLVAAPYAVRIVAARLNDGRTVMCQGLHGSPDDVSRFLDEMNSELARRDGKTARLQTEAPTGIEPV